MNSSDPKPRKTMNPFTTKNRKIIFLLCISTMASYGQTRRANPEFKSDLLEQPTRMSIFELIEQNPGLHFRAICRALTKKMGVVQYHISILEKAQLIRSLYDGRYKCFFSTYQENIDPQDRDPVKDTLSDFIKTNLRKATASKVIIHLANEKQASHQQLSQVASVSPQAITFHVKRLGNLGILEFEKEGRKKSYQLSSLAREIIQDLFHID